MVTINVTLEPEKEKELLEFLRKNQDIFAWSANDLRGVSRDIIEHRMDINPNIKPKKQKLRTEVLKSFGANSANTPDLASSKMGN